MDTDRISDKDLVTHRKLMADLTALQAQQQFWSFHLTQAYELQEGDQVTPEGEIARIGQRAVRDMAIPDPPTTTQEEKEAAAAEAHAALGEKLKAAEAGRNGAKAK